MQDQAAKEKALAGLSTMSSAQIVSASVLQNTASARMFGTPGIAGNAVPMHTMLNSPGPGGPQQGSSPVVVKHELLNPAGLVGHFCYTSPTTNSLLTLQIWPPHVGAQSFVSSSVGAMVSVSGQTSELLVLFTNLSSFMWQGVAHNLY